MHACCIPVPNETKAAFMQFLHHPSFEPGLHELTECTSIAMTPMAVNVTVNSVSQVPRETRV